MNIQEQIEDARRWADDERKCGDGARAVSIDGYADTMEKMLAVVEAAQKWRKAIGSDGEAGCEGVLCDALSALALEERE